MQWRTPLRPATDDSIGSSRQSVRHLKAAGWTTDPLLFAKSDITESALVAGKRTCLVAQTSAVPIQDVLRQGSAGAGLH